MRVVFNTKLQIKARHWYPTFYVFRHDGSTQPTYNGLSFRWSHYSLAFLIRPHWYD